MKKTYPVSRKAQGSHRGPHLTKDAKRRVNKSTRALGKVVGVVVSILAAVREIAPDALDISSDGGDEAIQRTL